MRRALTILSLIAMLAPLPVGAVNATSTSFYVRQNIQSTSGGNGNYSFSTSTNFQLLSAGGQTANGTSTSGTTYSLYGGFLRNLFKSITPVYAQTHYHWRLNNGTETTATAAIAEDTATTSVQLYTPQRLRIQIANLGGTEAQYDTQQLALEYAEKAFPCDDGSNNWFPLGGIGDGVEWEATSSQLVDFADTTNISTAIGGVTDSNHTFIAINHGSLESGPVSDLLFSIPSDSFVEYEYSIAATEFATPGGTYCFRLQDASYGSLYRFDVYPEATLVAGGNSLPVASAVSIDSGATSVTLIEGATKNVVCSGTVTDNDGFSNISAVGGFLYRTGVGTSSASDNNNLYRQYGDTQCVPSGGAGLSETYTCTFPVQYYADATDAGSPNAADTWSCELHPRDTVATGTPATDTVEMGSLMALDVTSTIGYGSVNANTDTGSTNQPTTIANTGNRDMDPQVSGTSMTGAGTISSSQQKYLASAFTYSGGGTALSGTPTQVNLDLPQRTTDGSGNVAATFQTSANSTGTGEVFCSVPSGTSNGDLLLGFATTYDDNSVTVATPSGWTAHSGPNRRTAGNLITTYVFYKIAGASEPLGYVFDASPDQYINCSILRYSGVDQAAPLLAATSSNNGSGTTRTGTGITTILDNTKLVLFSAGYSGAPTAVPSGMTQRVLYDTVIGIYDETIATAGATADRTQSQSPSDTWVTTMLGIKPLSSGIVTDLLYWGLGVPNGTPNGSYTGMNTFTAAAGI